MARPKTTDRELKDQRIPIMMSPSEVAALDDWMHEHRIRSRGEAIRRLCKTGLEVTDQMPVIMRIAANMYEKHSGSTLQGIETPPRDDTFEDWYFKREFKREADDLAVMEEMVVLVRLLDALAKRIDVLAISKNLRDAILRSQIEGTEAIAEALAHRVEFFELRKKLGATDEPGAGEAPDKNE